MTAPTAPCSRFPPGSTRPPSTPAGSRCRCSSRPQLPDPATRPNTTSVFVPVRCEVDGDRRVSCTGQWADLAANTLTDEPGACDFLLLVAVPEVPP